MKFVFSRARARGCVPGVDGSSTRTFGRMVGTRARGAAPADARRGVRAGSRDRAGLGGRAGGGDRGRAGDAPFIFNCSPSRGFRPALVDGIGVARSWMDAGGREAKPWKKGWGAAVRGEGRGAARRFGCATGKRR